MGVKLLWTGVVLSALSLGSWSHTAQTAGGFIAIIGLVLLWLDK